jgi:hypothetical protein
VAAAGNHTVGLKSDGTVVAVGEFISGNSFFIPGWDLSSAVQSSAAPMSILLPLTLTSSAVLDPDPEKAVPIGVGPLA